MHSQMIRLVLVGVTVFAALTLASSPAQASTDLLTPPSTTPSGNISTQSDDFPAWKITPSSSATLESVTATYNNTSATGYKVVVYTDTLAGPGSIVGELSQSNSGSATVEFTGSVLMSVGTTYWVGFQGSQSSSTGFLSNLNYVSAGTQTSPWQWGTGLQDRARIQPSSTSLFPSSLFPIATLTGSVRSGPDSDANSGQSGSLPKSIIQQFGVPEVGTCDSAQPADLNWSGVSNGGWRVSWAQWMNAGRGGPVCTRELAYISGRWIVA